VDATNLNKENPENAACKSGIFFFIFIRRSPFGAKAGSHIARSSYLGFGG
jgi:hypothetical protein